MRPAATTILFGPFDRHNLGDLLFAHIVTALLPDVPLTYAGVATRDMRPFGGYAVTAISELAKKLDCQVNLIHVGGEILTCEAEEAQPMLSSPADEVPHVCGPAPYLSSKRLFRTPGTVVLNSVGGVALEHASAALRGAVIEHLKCADIVTVRDRYTQATLAQLGIEAALVPDSGVMTAALFGDRIAHRKGSGAVANTNRTIPAGFVAMQFSADFADDATLDTLASQCDALCGATDLGIALFRAGAAPLHDRLDLYHSVRQRMRNPARAVIFESLDIWDICALIAASRGYLGSSLHGRIIALSLGLPRVTLGLADRKPNKHRAFIEAWEDPSMPGMMPPEHGAAALLEAMSIASGRSERQAAHLVACYRAGCREWQDRIRQGR